jgi:23S rRNA (guanosine2251-2'-O)-methyltransferase
MSMVGDARGAAAGPTRLVFGFHAVAARLRSRPGSVLELYVAEGRGDARLRQLLATAGERGVRIVHLPAERLDRMLPGQRHQGVAAAVRIEAMPQHLDDVLDGVTGHPLVLALDGVQDPHNLGACLRCADAMGVHAVIAPKDRAVGITPVVEKVASGATESVPYVMVTNLARELDVLKDRGLFAVGLAGEAEDGIAGQRLDGPLVLVMGAEGGGMRRLTRERCDVLVRIPMFGQVESLNVSVAAGICLYEARRQRAAREAGKH